MRRFRAGITAEQFVRAWQASANVPEVARLTGMSQCACRSRARAYRKLGIDLQRFKDGPITPIVDVPRLQKIAKEARR